MLALEYEQPIRTGILEGRRVGLHPGATAHHWPQDTEREYGAYLSMQHALTESLVAYGRLGTANPSVDRIGLYAGAASFKPGAIAPVRRQAGFRDRLCAQWQPVARRRCSAVHGYGCSGDRARTDLADCTWRPHHAATRPAVHYQSRYEPGARRCHRSRCAHRGEFQLCTRRLTPPDLKMHGPRCAVPARAAPRDCSATELAMRRARASTCAPVAPP